MCCSKKKYWTKQKTITPLPPTPFKLNGRSLNQLYLYNPTFFFNICDFNLILTKNILFKYCGMSTYSISNRMKYKCIPVSIVPVELLPLYVFSEIWQWLFRFSSIFPKHINRNSITYAKIIKKYEDCNLEITPQN